MRIAVILIALGVAVSVSEAQRLSREDSAHVAAARSVYNAVRADAAAHRLIRRDTVLTCAGHPAVQFRVTLEADSTQTVRRFTFTGASEDHGEQVEYYYDQAGALRFAFARRDAVNGAAEEERVYYAPGGAVAQRLRSWIRGANWAFGDIAPVREPARFGNALCR